MACTEAEREAGSCNNSRPDSTIDWAACGNTDQDDASGSHFGWVADVAAETTRSRRVIEGGTADAARTCNMMASWCCSQ